MEILAYDPSLSSEATALYNRIVDGVPHCYPVGEAEFAAALAPAAGFGPPHARLHAQAAFVAREGDSLVGFAHTAIGLLGNNVQRIFFSLYVFHLANIFQVFYYGINTYPAEIKYLAARKDGR